jgi:hypothetical protein
MLKQQMFLLDSFAMGLLYLKRLNFGVISLIPKVPSADQITHF